MRDLPPDHVGLQYEKPTVEKVEYQTIYLSVWGREDGDYFRIDGVPANVVEALQHLAGLFTWIAFVVDTEPLEWVDESRTTRVHWDELTRD